MFSGDCSFHGVLGFFVPHPQDGEDVDRFYSDTCAEIDSQIWLICMTIQGWGYWDVMKMPEMDRKSWAERCEEHQDKIQEEVNAAKNRH